MALRWKKNEAERGLANIGAPPEGSTLCTSNGTEVATTNATKQRGGYGWFWVAGWGHKDIPHKNTCTTPVATELLAKAEARAYVKKHLKAD